MINFHCSNSVKNLFVELTCDSFCDLVPFIQFKKREKHPQKSDTFSKVAGLTFTVDSFEIFEIGNSCNSVNLKTTFTQRFHKVLLTRSVLY